MKKGDISRAALQSIARDAGRTRLGERGDKDRVPMLMIELGLAKAEPEPDEGDDEDGDG